MGRTDDAALWRRWRSAAGQGAAAAVEPEALLLAAYAEDRLAGELAEAVEDWLATHPEAIGDVLAARHAAAAALLPAAAEAVVERACSLVAPGTAQVLPFRPAPQARSWRQVASWSAIAASLVVASLVGFELGNDTYLNLATSSAPALGQELIDPPTGLFYGLDEDSSI